MESSTQEVVKEQTWAQKEALANHGSKTFSFTSPNDNFQRLTTHANWTPPHPPSLVDGPHHHGCNHLQFL